jgi:hypothetical protein
MTYATKHYWKLSPQQQTIQILYSHLSLNYSLEPKEAICDAK